jgi:glycosyltransferase involved in cell wall biosynthesis
MSPSLEGIDEINVVFFISDLGDGGAQKQCLLLARAMNVHTNFRVSVVSIRGGYREKFLVENAVPYKVLGVRSGFDPRAAIALRGYMDSVHSNTVVSWLHAADVQSFLASRLLKDFRWIMTERDSSYPNSFRYRIRSYVAQFSDVIVANSRAGAAMWKNRYPNASVVQTGNIISRSVGKKNLQSGYDVVMVCRLEEQKNVINAVEALVFFSTTNPEKRVAILGDGSLRTEIEEILSSSGSSVKILGFVEDAWEVISNSSVLFSLSRHEGLPNVVLEALGSKTIPVLSSIPEHIEIVGEHYPFLVSLESSASQLSLCIESAFSAGAINEIGHLETLIASMGEEAIVSKYVEILSTLNKKEST